MKHKHLAGLAALLVGTMGGAAFGDDHETGGDPEYVVVCPHIGCQRECQVYGECLIRCLTGGACPSEGDVKCATERRLYGFCLEDNQSTFPPGLVGGVLAPPCPDGQHRNEAGECECGDDEIGGGGEDCKPCGEGEVPNEDRTACVACDWGEETPGVCNREPCQRSDADAAANSALSGSGIMRKEAQERGQIIYCENGQVKHGAWAISGSDKCRVYPESPHGRSCLAGGSKRTGCNLTAAHSHPYFIYDRDENLRCGDTRITSPAVADELNRINMVFTSLDIATLTARQTDGHLLVSDRSAILPWRYLAVFPIPWAASTAGAEASNDD